jgi:hypothetical protein
MGTNIRVPIHVFGVRGVKRIGTIDALFAIQNKCRRPLNEVIKRGQSTNLDRLSHPPNQDSKRGWITKHLRIRSGANFSNRFEIAKKISNEI